MFKCILTDNLVNTRLLAKQTHKRENYALVNNSTSNSNPGSSDAGASGGDGGGGGAHIQILQRIRSRYYFTETYGLHWPFCMLWDRMIRKSNANAGKRCEDRNFNCLVGGTVWIPRYPNILNDTSTLVSADIDRMSSDTNVNANAYVNVNSSPFSTCPYGEDIPLEVEITCPSSCIGNASSENGKTVEYCKTRGFGYRNFKACNIEDLNLQTEISIPGTSETVHVPIILHFHGGAYALGTARDFFPIVVASLLQHKMKTASRSGGSSSPSHSLPHSLPSPPPVILVSVNYRLAPECPFPGPIIDCLSAAKYFIETFPNAAIHLSGISAGANAAMVVGMECTRMYPPTDTNSLPRTRRGRISKVNVNGHVGVIKSIAVIQPMFMPLCNTRSFDRFTSTSSLSSSFLMWGWSSYLQLNGEPQQKTDENECNDGDDDDDDDDGKNGGRVNDSFGAFDRKEKYMNDMMNHPLFQVDASTNGTSHPLLRLVWPQVDLPIFKVDAHVPKIIVTTSSNDPLRDDGLDLIECLHAKDIPVQAFKCYGDHGYSILTDSTWRKEFVSEWGKCLWPVKESDKSCNG